MVYYVVDAPFRNLNAGQTDIRQSTACQGPALRPFRAAGKPDPNAEFAHNIASWERIARLRGEGVIPPAQEMLARAR